MDLVRNLLSVGPIRFALWTLVERMNWSGRKFLTLRQHRQLALGLNRKFIDEELSDARPDDQTSIFLDENGWCQLHLPRVTVDAALADALDIADKKIATTPKRPNPFSVAGTDELAKVDSIRNLVLSPEIRALAEKYFGATPYVRDIDILLSDVQEGLYGAQFYHLDNINQRALRFIFLLEDVSETNGPFTFYPVKESVRVLEGTRYMDRRDYAVLGDDEVAAASTDMAPTKLTGTAGDIFLADTCRCLHCGSRVEKGRRLLIMATITPKLPSNIRWLSTGNPGKLLSFSDS